MPLTTSPSLGCAMVAEGSGGPDQCGGLTRPLPRSRTTAPMALMLKLIFGVGAVGVGVYTFDPLIRECAARAGPAPSPSPLQVLQGHENCPREASRGALGCGRARGRRARARGGADRPARCALPHLVCVAA